MISRIILSGIMLLFAQVTFAQVEGEVTDANNKAIPNAIVIATDATGKVMDTVKTDSSGLYVFKKLMMGKYKIEAKATGFLPAIFKNIEIEKTPKPYDPWDDGYYAIRLDIVLRH